MLNTHEDVLNKISELEERLKEVNQIINDCEDELDIPHHITREEGNILHQLNALNEMLISMGTPEDHGEEV